MLTDMTSLIKVLKIFISYNSLKFLFIFIISSNSAEDEQNNSNLENITVLESDLQYDVLNSTNNDSEYDIRTVNENLSFPINFSNKEIKDDSQYSLSTDIDMSIIRSFTTPDEDICGCDLLLNACDINCCCDLDCSDEDIKVFSKCHSQVLIPDKNYCYQKDILFRNNTIYKMVKDPDSALFCIVHDNFKEHLRFKDLPVIKSHRDLNIVLKHLYKNIFSWDTSDDSEINERSGMTVGNPIFIDFDLKKLEISTRHWSLPSSCFTSICSCEEEIHYLEDFKSSCNRVIMNLEAECNKDTVLSANFYSNFCINPRSASTDIVSQLAELITHTKAMNSSSDVSNENLSSKTNKLCLHSNSKFFPKYFKNSDVCENVVKSVHFVVEHDGVNGIRNVTVHFDLTKLDNTAEIFRQHFTVDFKWTNVTEVSRKSGNPGYQIGFPILAGTNSTSIDSDQPFSITIHPDGLSILDKSSAGKCSNKRRSIKFGKNLKSGCHFKILSKDCKIIQERILAILLGPSRKQIFVGLFGNANSSNSDDWIEVYHEEFDASSSAGACYISTDLEIDILYAAVGTVVNPQHKILGVGYHYIKPEIVDVSCSPMCPDLTLSTSVSFFDITQPTIPVYPKLPTIKANLPSDFFYPFVHGRSSTCTVNVFLTILYFILNFLILK